jgi:hypothetical protein
MKFSSIIFQTLHIASNATTLACLWAIVFSSSRCTALKIVPVQQQIQKVDVGFENQLLQVAFKEAYAYLHSERLKSIGNKIGGPDAAEHAKVVRKLKNSIDRWTILEEKLQTSVSPESLASFKQVLKIGHFRWFLHCFAGF